MANWILYYLVSGEHSVEYVGITTDLQRRFYQHTKCKPHPGNGKFYGRTDLRAVAIQEFPDRQSAHRNEISKQSLFGFVNEVEKKTKNSAYTQLAKPYCILDGKTLTLTELANKLGIPKKKISIIKSRRDVNHWNIEFL